MCGIKKLLVERMLVMRKKTLVRFVAGICTFIILFIMNCPLSNADVVWEPEDDFYKTHADECQYVRARDLIANGPGGRVTIWESPVSDREVGEIKNGSKVGAEYTYEDKRGYTWGIVYMAGGKTGWVPMDYLVKEPGLKNFTLKHSDEYQEYSGGFLPPEDVEIIYFWSYPGSGEIINKTVADHEDAISITSSYTDNEGRQWGYVTYFRAISGWICLSDPSNNKIPVNEEDAADVVIPPEPTEIIAPESEGINVFIVVAVLVAAVVVGTVILVRVLFRKKTAKTDTGKAPNEIK